MHYKIKENYIIVSKDAEKAADKTKHPFMIKTLSEMGIEEKYHNIRQSYMPS